MNIKMGVLCIALGSTACALNQSGNWNSSSGGDTSHPAERRSPTAELDAACGTGAVTETGRSVLHRLPYLQQVSSTHAMVGWTSTQPAGGRVQLTTPDGNAVTMSLAEEEPKVLLPNANENEMWTTADNLQPSTIYCYQVANDSGMLTERAGFKTAPAADSTAPVRFLAFGDSGGGGSDQFQLQQQMLTVPYDLIIHTGDVAYQDGTMAQYESNVFDVYADQFRSIPFFPAAGNHDYHTQAAEPFREVFNLPGTSGEKWYSYDWGPVHFVALDTESDYKTQMTWLEDDLTATQAPWKVIYMHRPPYSSGAHGSDGSLRKLLAPIVKRHAVQLVLSGHDHDYERMLPQDGTQYLVTGGGGIGTYNVGSSTFTAFADSVIHFVYGEVGPEQMILHAIDANGREFDSVVVPRAI